MLSCPKCHADLRAHGTRYCYMTGCRCAKCSQANLAYFRNYRKRKYLKLWNVLQVKAGQP